MVGYTVLTRSDVGVLMGFVLFSSQDIQVAFHLSTIKSCSKQHYYTPIHLGFKYDFMYFSIALLFGKSHRSWEMCLYK